MIEVTHIQKKATQVIAGEYWGMNYEMKYEKYLNMNETQGRFKESEYSVNINKIEETWYTALNNQSLVVEKGVYSM